MSDNPTPEPVPKPKNAGHANLRPNPHTLKKGGRKPLGVRGIKQIRFCARYAVSGSVPDAAIFAGLHPSNAYELLHRPAIAEQIKKEQQRLVDGVLVEAKKDYELSVSDIDAYMMHLLVNGKDEYARTKSGEVMYRRLKLIQPPSVSATSTSTAAAATQQIDIYKPAWLRDNETKLRTELETKYGSVALQLADKNLTHEKAIMYMQRAGGDRDKAREMARTDGFTF